MIMDIISIVTCVCTLGVVGKITYDKIRLHIVCYKTSKKYLTND